MASSKAASVLMTAQVECDVTMRIIGLSDLVVAGDLYSIWLPDPGFPPRRGSQVTSITLRTGVVSLSPSTSISRIYLGVDNTYLSAERLTGSSDGFAEWKPSFSPDGSRIAYTAGAIRGSGVRDTDLYSLTLGPRVAIPVTTRKNKGGAASGRNNAIWSSDGAWIGFTAFTSRTPRRSPCSGLLNSEIFLIPADGSTTATQITNTNGTRSKPGPTGVGGRGSSALGAPHASAASAPPIPRPQRR